MNGQMHKDYNVSRRARRKDTLSTEDLGIPLEWHWKYGMSIFANERQRGQMGLLGLFATFTASRPGTLLAGDNSPSKDPVDACLAAAWGLCSSDAAHFTPTIVVKTVSG